MVIEYGKTDTDDWLKHRAMKKRIKSIFDECLCLIAMIGIIAFCVGFIIAINMPQYKAHVKDGVVTVMPM